MAYKIQLWLKCSFGGCAKNATYKVCNRYNAEIGKYCATHATSILRDIEREENRK